MSFKNLAFFIASLFFSLPTFASASLTLPQLPTFSSAEHIAIGDDVVIKFSPDTPGQKSALLHLPNQLNLSYGTILALGDFYGTPGQPISAGNSENEKRARFLAAFNQFAVNNPTDINQIVTIMQAEKKLIEDGLKNGESEESIYQKVGDDFDRQYNCVTGGSCVAKVWWTYAGRYLLLAKDDYDHFGDDAWAAYQTGHAIALEAAMHAHQTQDIQALQLAYALNAFAGHFLSDRFATGHIRTPRKLLPIYVSPTVVGDVLVNYMHNEENFYSLHVHNLQGDHWIAYGDKSYFTDKGATHRQQLLATLQVSADEIFSTYLTGIAPQNDIVSQLIPIPDEVANAANQDISPLFYWDKQTNQLLRREDIANLYDKHWTASWWGWSTLLALKKNQGISLLAQVALAQSTLHEKAVQEGLIPDVRVVDYLHAGK
ncbi:MAG: phospholipase [Gammaproteobacteria bacterium]|nr:phospholipase [Gammaproteobacteria bacterium]